MTLLLFLFLNCHHCYCYFVPEMPSLLFLDCLHCYSIINFFVTFVLELTLLLFLFLMDELF